MKEIRTAEIRAQAPTAEGANGLIIEGVAIVFDTPTTIHDPAGDYIEVIKGEHWTRQTLATAGYFIIMTLAGCHWPERLKLCSLK